MLGVFVGCCCFDVLNVSCVYESIITDCCGLIVWVCLLVIGFVIGFGFGFLGRFGWWLFLFVFVLFGLGFVSFECSVVCCCLVEFGLLLDGSLLGCWVG